MMFGNRVKNTVGNRLTQNNLHVLALQTPTRFEVNIEVTILDIAITKNDHIRNITRHANLYFDNQR